MRTVVSTLLEKHLDLVGVGPFECHHQHILQRLHRRYHEIIRPVQQTEGHRHARIHAMPSRERRRPHNSNNARAGAVCARRDAAEGTGRTQAALGARSGALYARTVREGARARSGAAARRGSRRGAARWRVPALVVKVVGGEKVVGGMDRHEDLARLLLARHVLIRVPLERHLAEAHLDLVEVAVVLLLDAEEVVGLIGGHRHARDLRQRLQRLPRVRVLLLLHASRLGELVDVGQPLRILDAALVRPVEVVDLLEGGVTLHLVVGELVHICASTIKRAHARARECTPRESAVR